MRDPADVIADALNDRPRFHVEDANVTASRILAALRDEYEVSCNVSGPAAAVLALHDHLTGRADGCLVVTGDLDAVCRRLAPIPADVRARAIDAAAHALDGMQEPGDYLAARAVDALCAAGLIRLPAEEGTDA